jgi:uncharacterized DUF497 family protein
MQTPDFSKIIGFDWDEGNLYKNWEKHGVSTGECEEVFFNDPFFSYFDNTHSTPENRFYVLGETNQDRKLFVVFTIRKNKLRVISARDMSKKERHVYENLKKDTQFQK